MEWSDLQVFLTVAKEGSFADAAKALKNSYTTVSRRIENLEKNLGATLFIRQHGELSLTTEGQEMMMVAKKVASLTGKLERRLQGLNQKLEGDITITLSKAVLSGLLMPNLSAFKNKHPDINIEFNTGRAFLDIMKGEADIAIRLTDNHEYQIPDNLIGLRLPDIHVHAYANKKIAKAINNGKPPADIGWIKWDKRINFTQMYSYFDQENWPIKWTIDDVTAQVDATEAGIGIGILPCFLGDSNSKLARIYPKLSPLSVLDAWVVAHPDMRNVERIRACMHFVAEAFNEQKDLIAGTLSK